MALFAAKIKLNRITLLWGRSPRRTLPGVRGPKATLALGARWQRAPAPRGGAPSAGLTEVGAEGMRARPWWAGGSHGNDRAVAKRPFPAGDDHGCRPQACAGPGPPL